MSKKRLVLITTAVALIAFAAACGSALENEGAQSSGPASIDNAPGAPPEDGFDRSTVGNGEELSAFDADDAAFGNGALGFTGSDPAQTQQLQGLLDRRIIQSTSVSLESEDISRNFQDVIRFADVAGGFVASSTFTNDDDFVAGDVTIKVPGASYHAVLADIRGLGNVTSESSDSNDVTEEYVDLQARLRTLTATEQRYLELLAQADEIPEILTVQDRLDFVRGQIEQVQGRINLLENQTDLATISVHLREPSAAAVGANGGGNGLDPLESAAQAWETSLDALRNVAAVTLVIVVFSWWIAPLLAIGAFGARWWNNRRPRATAIEPQAS